MSVSRVDPCAPDPARKPGYHLLLKGDGFSVQDCVCRLVRGSPASENRFRANRVAVMLGGAFHYESDFGPTLLGPGSMLLGRSGGNYCFRHIDDGGDRSVIFDLSDELLEEARRSLGQTRPTDFCVPSIPASSHTVAVTTLTRRALRLNDPEVWEDTALLVAMTAVSGPGPPCTPPRKQPALTDADRRQVIRAVRYIESHHHQDCSLRVLADGAGMSIFRFLRVFKILTSQTPRQYLLATRLSTAASRLIETRGTVLEIAYGAGFGDISHFNHVFAAAFGVSPTRFRRST